MKLDRVTTQYDNAQDRYRVLGSTPEGNTLEVWITQRLFIRIIRVLIEWLETNSDPSPVSRAKTLQAKSSIQNFAQQNASANMPVTTPVEPKVGALSYLLAEVDIRKGDKHVVLVFKLPENELAEIPFDSTQLRQWLNIVHKQWLGAEWPLGIWPEWMDESAEKIALDTDSVSFH
jgi:hypothetical protein